MTSSALLNYQATAKLPPEVSISPLVARFPYNLNNTGKIMKRCRRERNPEGLPNPLCGQNKLHRKISLNAAFGQHNSWRQAMAI